MERKDSAQIEFKRQKEQKMVGKMMVLYCKSKHGRKAFKERGLCPQCRELLDYAEWKIRKCPFMEEKTFCSNCRVHCYKKEMRERIRQVMVFSGPRMLLYAPKAAIWHVICTLREKRKMKND